MNEIGFDKIMENMRQRAFHMSDEEVYQIVDDFLDIYPMLLENHDKEWFYKNV